jgi:hypothetical protein
MLRQLKKNISGAMCLYQGLLGDITVRQFLASDTVPLTLTQMAGGKYDSWNFE